MPTPFSTPLSSVALYWDFENLHASLCEARQEGLYSKPDNRFRVQEPLVDVQAVVDFAASLGPIAINRAYCNWQYFGRYRDLMLQNAIELIQLFPPGGTAKNGADIKLCLDAMDDVGRFGHLSTVIIVGGDSDFMPVAQKIRASGRTLVGVGSRKATNRHWAKSCHDFRFYEHLTAQDASHPSAASVPSTVQPDSSGGQTHASEDPVVDLLRRAVRLLQASEHHGAGSSSPVWVPAQAVWSMVKRLDATFDPRDHGYASFDAMLAAMAALFEYAPLENPTPSVHFINPSMQWLRLRAEQSF